MALFADTSAFFAISAEGDRRYADALRFWQECIDAREELVSTNYVVVETFVLMQRRLGLAAARRFQTDIVPVLQVEWIDEPTHRSAVAATLSAGLRNLSLVDCVSFEVMRRLGLDQVFAFDADFENQGFRCLP